MAVYFFKVFMGFFRNLLLEVEKHKATQKQCHEGVQNSKPHDHVGIAAEILLKSMNQSFARK